MRRGADGPACLLRLDGDAAWYCPNVGRTHSQAQVCLVVGRDGVALRCRSVRVGFAPRRVLNAAYEALAADLASRGVVYGSASSLLDAVRDEACNPMCWGLQPRACSL